MKINNKYLINRLIIVWLMFTLTFGFYTIPIKSESLNQETIPKTSQFISRNIRIAIYNEPNVTSPYYVSVATLTNNYTAIKTNLINSGYQVSELTCEDIYNHKLKTSDFDVLILADNVPRENITNYIKEFWLGGGAILSFDSALAYLCYFGILIPDSAGDDGWGTYWTYMSSPINNISMRHPASKSYDVDDTFTLSSLNWAVLDWVALQGSIVFNDFYRIAFRQGDTDDVSVLAYDPTILSGGKVMHVLSNFMLDADDLIINAVEWLCPRPKGRLLFDLSHLPYYGIDPWDTLADYYPRYEIMRDYLVNRSYTIDKLYPSLSGNLTSTNLAPYDVLIIALSNYNFTSNEVSTVTNWVNNGGSLLVYGELIGLNTQNENINYLLTNFDLKMNLTDSGSGVATYQLEHPIHEDSTQLSVSAPGKIVYSGDAYPILGSDADNIYIGGQEYGDGRIILISDIAPFRDSTIMSTDNLQYCINIINWLTADDAEVLAFVYEHSNPDPNDNIYRGPVATALNDLGLSFYLTFNEAYFNLSLVDTSYKLVIIDNVINTIMDTVGVPLLNFLKSGGFLILNTWTYRTATYNYLWDYLGFSYAGSYSTTPEIINIWDTTHPIFNTPADFGATTIETSLDFTNTDYTNLTLHSNATGIAGLTVSPNNSMAAIILGANGHAITNAMHLTEYYDDTDDSTYPDGLEIWENEIAYMMSIIYPPTEPDGFNIIWIIIIVGIIIGALAIVIIFVRRRKKL
jgi:hypothetical protein